MRSSHLTVLFVLLSGPSGCAHVREAPASAPAASAYPATAEKAAEAEGEPAEPQPEVSAMVEAAGPDATVVVMEAEDLGGGADMVVAPPKRPTLPSMMTDIAMAPSR